jgi:hypothetical protein
MKYGDATKQIGLIFKNKCIQVKYIMQWVLQKRDH